MVHANTTAAQRPRCCPKCRIRRRTLTSPSCNFLAAISFRCRTEPPIGNGDTGIFSFAAQEITPENYFTIRFDHKFSDSDSIYATYIRDNSTTVQPGTFGELSSDIVSNRQAATLHEDHIFSSNLLNSARIGFSRAVGIIGQGKSGLQSRHERFLLRLRAEGICRGHSEHSGRHQLFGRSDRAGIYSLEPRAVLDHLPGRR